MRRERVDAALQDAAERNLPLLRSEIAILLGCSEGHIKKYQKMGMPCMFLCIRKDGIKSHARYLYKDCMAWLNKTLKGGAQ